MKITYACDFSLTKNAGKNRATRQKIAALGRTNDIELKVYSPGGGFLMPFQLVFNELKILLRTLRCKPDVVISRGGAGWLVLFAKPIVRFAFVREIHAAGFEELKLIPFKGLKRQLAILKAGLSLYLDKKADLRIFNHPQLLDWYESKYNMRGKSCFVYNGFDPSSRSRLSRAEARKKFNLSEGVVYLVFSGSASKWHGVEYLVELQRCFNDHGDPAQVVCGGGSMEHYDHRQLCLNFSPMNDKDCADLIRAADACLLPVADIRISPGSPLKLYDYLANKRTVIAQKDQVGYSDEVYNHGVGFSVDFGMPEEARKTIINKVFCSVKRDDDYNWCCASWDDRVSEWLANIREIKEVNRNDR